MFLATGLAGSANGEQRVPHMPVGIAAHVIYDMANPAVDGERKGMSESEKPCRRSS
jgi:hypothetical protein